MLSDEGYLKTLPPVSLQPAFEQVVGEVVNGLRHALGNILHSIYLYGSVARGNAVTGVSDLDVCVILRARCAWKKARSSLVCVRIWLHITLA